MRGSFRPLLLVMVLLLPLGGCGLDLSTPAALATGAAAVTVPIFGRALPDVAVSLIRNQDCSIVRIEQGKSYCRAPDPPPDPPTQVVCTRSLGDIDCFSNPMAVVGQVKSVADGPTTLTPDQEAYRTRGWLW